jgi:hypothetical protein
MVRQLLGFATCVWLVSASTVAVGRVAGDSNSLAPRLAEVLEKLEAVRGADVSDELKERARLAVHQVLKTQLSLGLKGVRPLHLARTRGTASKAYALVIGNGNYEHLPSLETAVADAEAVAAGRFAPDVARVDAQRLADDAADHETPLSEVFEDQISCADVVLLTKPDLAGPEGVARAREVIAAEAPRPLPVIEVAEGAVDPRVILGLAAAAEDDLKMRPSHHDGLAEHDHEDFDSVVVELPDLVSPADLTARIEHLARERNVLRVKGYAAVAGKPMRLLVQAVGARVRTQYDRPWGADEPRCGRLVVIAEAGDIDEAAIRAALAG